MAIFASTTLGSSDPYRAQSIKALEARAQALAQAQAQQKAPESMPSPWQGAGYLANTIADSINVRRADEATAQRRKDLAGYISNLGDNPTMAQLGPIAAADTDMAKAIMSEIQQRRLAADKARTDQEYLVKSDQLNQAHPQSDIGKLQADFAAGRMTKEQFDTAVEQLTAPKASDIKARTDQENTHIEAQSYANTLDEAKDLVTHGVYNGNMAGLQGEYGKGPAGAVTNKLGMTDPDTTRRTDRYNKIMNAVALQITKSMSGSQSDKELQNALDTARNPNSSENEKIQALDTLIAKAKLHTQVAEESVKSLRGTPKYLDPYVPGSSLALKPPIGSTAAPTSTAPAGPVQEVASEAEALKLAPGTRFKLPDGRTGTAR